jgi:hypothetical protein
MMKEDTKNRLRSLAWVVLIGHALLCYVVGLVVLMAGVARWVL